MDHWQGKIGLLGTGIYQGQAKRGVEEAYGRLQSTGVFSELKKAGLNIHDFGDLSKVDTSEPYELLKNKTSEILNKNHLPLLIGGDHSQAFATISSLVELYPDLRVLWWDAHGDMNTPTTSPSGNTHGMPLSGLLGLVDKEAFGMPWMKQSLKPENVALLGIRDLDPGEWDLVKSSGVIHYSSTDIEDLGMSTVLENISTTWKERGPVHLSFDIDGLDSSLVPATGTPVQNGLSLAQMELFCKGVNQLFDVVGFEIVEFNPLLAKNERELKTTDETIKQLLLSMMTS